MTNSDSGNRPRPAAHQPGDLVQVRRNPKHDHHNYSVEQNRARQALGGQIATIRERTAADAYRVAPPGSTERGAWFEADELEPPLPPIGSRVGPEARRRVNDTSRTARSHERTDTPTKTHTVNDRSRQPQLAL